MYLKAPSLAVAPVFSAHRSESSEAYPHIVASLTPKLRVIDDLSCQWILQVRKSPTRFESIAYCATCEGLLLRIKRHLQPRDAKKILPLVAIAKFCDPDALRAVMELPEFYNPWKRDAESLRKRAAKAQLNAAPRARCRIKAHA